MKKTVLREYAKLIVRCGANVQKGQEVIIYADLDMTLPAACKMEHDAVGHYARPDVLNLIVEDK